MLKNKRVFTLFCLLLTTNLSIAQVDRSAYHVKGLGTLYERGTAANFGKGGVGVSKPTPFQVNMINPSLLVYNYITLFDIGLIGQSKVVLTDNSAEQFGSANLAYLTFVFQLDSGKWVTSIGLMPYTSVDYDNLNLYSEQGVPVLNSNTGEGGVNQVFWSNGFKPFDKINLSLGLKAAYLFGSIVQENIYRINDPALTTYPTSSIKRKKFSDFFLGTGAHYRFRFRADSVNGRLQKKFINIGANVEWTGNTNIDYYRALERLDPSGIANSSLNLADTLEDQRTSVFIPPRYDIGFSYENENKFSWEVDFTWQDWRKYENVEKSNESLNFYYKIASGIEWQPDFRSTSYLNRVFYRAGFSYIQTPYMFDDAIIEDFGINFGVGLPIGPVVRPSILNLGFRLGTTGTTAENLIRENYFQFLVGFNFLDKWFQRRRYN